MRLSHQISLKECELQHFVIWTAILARYRSDLSLCENRLRVYKMVLNSKKIIGKYEWLFWLGGGYDRATCVLEK